MSGMQRFTFATFVITLNVGVNLEREETFFYEFIDDMLIDFMTCLIVNNRES